MRTRALRLNRDAVISGNTIKKVDAVTGLAAPVQGLTGAGNENWTGIIIQDGHGVEVEADNVIEGFTEGVWLRPRKVNSGGTSIGLYTPPVILGNSFVNNAIGVKVVEATGNISGTPVAPTLYISCNTFAQTQPTGRSYTGNAYGIYGDDGAWFKIDDPGVLNGGATMKNWFIPGNPPNGLFKHLYNASGNNNLDYIAFATNSNQQTNAGNIIKEDFAGNINIISGDNFIGSGSNANNCQSDGFSEGVQTRLANAVKPTENPKIIDYLEQNYPNPFALETSIRYALPEGKEQGALVIRDIVTGKVVMRQELKAKTGIATLQINNLAAGIYVYTLETNGEPIASKKWLSCRNDK